MMVRMADDIDLSGTRVDPGRGSSSRRGGAPGGDGGSGRRPAALIGGAIALVVLLTWVLRNRQSARVDWLFGSTRAPLAIVILVSVALGFAAGYAVSALLRRRKARKPAE